MTCIVKSLSRPEINPTPLRPKIIAGALVTGVISGLANYIPVISMTGVTSLYIKRCLRHGSLHLFPRGTKVAVD